MSSDAWKTWWAPCLIAGVGLSAQCATFLNHDVAWVLYSSGRLLDGGVFGTDVVAANPPLIWWLSALPMAAARALSAPPELVFRVTISLLALASLAAIDRLARPRFGPWSRAWILGVAAYAFFFGVHRDFGQREHLALLLCSPYVLAVAVRRRGEPISRTLAASVGAAAALGIAFKPHLLAVPLACEAALCWRRRSGASLVRAESIAACAVGLVYLTSVVVFAGPYLTEVAPALARVYGAFDSPLGVVVSDHAGHLAILLALSILLWRARWPEAATLCAIAAGGFLVAGLAQSKGYSYHFYPVTALVLLSLAMLCSSREIHRLVIGPVVAMALLSSAFQSGRFLIHRSAAGEYGEHIGAMVGFVDARVPEGGRFLALSTHPYPGFPTALYAKSDWGAASNSRIFLPLVVQLRESPDGADPELLSFAESRERESMRRDVERAPDLVLVDVRPERHAIGVSDFDFLAFYREADWFEAFWSGYEEVEGAPPGFRAFVPASGSAS